MGVKDRFAAATEFPLLLTVEQAAEVLTIGRTLAYSLAHRYEESGGVAGLPMIRLGNCLRVPGWALLELACTGRVVALSELAVYTAEPLSPLQDEPPDAPIEEVRQVPEVAQSASSNPKCPKRPKRPASGAAAGRQVGEQLVLLPSD